MSQKDILSNIGSKISIFSLLKLILSHNSQLLREKLLLASDFAYIAANGFIVGLVFKYASQTIDYQQLMSLNSPFSILIGHQYFYLFSQSKGYLHQISQNIVVWQYPKY